MAVCESNQTKAFGLLTRACEGAFKPLSMAIVMGIKTHSLTHSFTSVQSFYLYRRLKMEQNLNLNLENKHEFHEID